MLYSGHLFLCSPVNKKKSPKTSHHRNSNHVYSRDLSLIFIKNISTFSFLRHHQTKSTDIHATMKGAHKKTVEKVHEMMLMWAQKKLSRGIFFLLVIFCVCTFRSLHSSIECGSGGNRHAVGKEKEAITIGTVRHTFFHFERNIHVNVSGIWNVGDSILVYIEDMRRRRRKKELKSRKRLYLHTWKHERETNHVRYAPMLLLLLLSIHDEFPFLGVIRELSTADEQFAEKQCKEKAQGKLFNLKLWWVFNLRSSIKQIFHQVPSSPCTSLENSKEKKWKKFH